MLAINLTMVRVVHRVLHSPVYDKAGRLPGLLPWAFGVSLCFSLLVLTFSFGARWIRHVRPVLVAAVFVNAIPLLLPRLLRIRQAEMRVQSIAFAYSGFLLCLVLLAAWYAIGNAQRANPWLVRIWIVAITTMIYVGTTGWMTISTGVTGDEPHYLLLTHSLVYDHDFDLSNNYAEKDYRAFYPYDMFPDTVPGRNSTMMLFHDIGLPILLVPGYAASGHTGAMLTVNVLTALLGLGIFEAALELGADTAAAILVWALFTFSAPLIIYASQIYPETTGAAGVLWAIVFFGKFMRYEQQRWLCWASVVLAVLPWLCIRYWMLVGPVTLIIGVFIVANYTSRGGVIERLLVLALPLMLSILLFAWFDFQHFGTVLPNAGYIREVAKYPQYTHVRPVQGIFGLLFDRLEGIIPIAPIYLFAFAGLIAVAKKSPWLVAALLGASSCYLGFMSLSQYWTGGWCPPARYSLASGILWAPAAAFVLRKPVQRWAMAIAVLWSIFPAVFYTALPEVRYPYRPDLSSSSLDLLVRKWLGFDFDVVFPSMIRSTRMDYLVGALWFCTAAVCVSILSRGATSADV